MNYAEYLSRVDLSKLIEENKIIDELRGRGPSSSSRCLLCSVHVTTADWLRLNDGEYICGACLSKTKRIKYPEQYQAQYEDHIRRCEAIRLAAVEESARVRSQSVLGKLDGELDFLQRLHLPLFFAGLLLFLSLKESRVWIVLCILVAASSRIVVRRLVEEKVKKKMQEWATANPLPSQPELLEFYDPRATLTDRDRAVLRVLDYWPGYPPFWKFLRQQVLNRDGKRCQITGCPNRLEPHVHHKTPLAKGGSHKPENLVTLCEYHHAMQDDMGHNRIRGQVVTPYFTYVQPYQRSDGVEVRGHLRHKKFATEDEISRIVTFYGIVCLLCGGILEAAVEEYRVVVRCLSQCCEDETKYRLSIPEEVGPAICLECRATRNLSAEDVYWRSYVSGKRMWGAPHSSKKHGASLREVDSDIAQEFKRVVSCPNPSCRKQMHVPTAGNPTMRCPHCKREFRAREITSSGMNPDEE